jgi:hypothetical protein
MERLLDKDSRTRDELCIFAVPGGRVYSSIIVGLVA